MGSLQRVHVYFSGHVQGVGYRRFVKRHATRIGLTGWVKNLPEGRVEAIIEGYVKDIDNLIRKSRRGSSLSQVNDIIVTIEPFTGEFSGFKIRY